MLNKTTCFTCIHFEVAFEDTWRVAEDFAIEWMKRGWDGSARVEHFKQYFFL